MSIWACLSWCCLGFKTLNPHKTKKGLMVYLGQQRLRRYTVSSSQEWTSTLRVQTYKCACINLSDMLFFISCLPESVFKRAEKKCIHHSEWLILLLCNPIFTLLRRAGNRSTFISTLNPLLKTSTYCFTHILWNASSHASLFLLSE